MEKCLPDSLVIRRKEKEKKGGSIELDKAIVLSERERERLIY